MDWKNEMHEMRQKLHAFNKTRPAVAQGFAALSKGAVESGPSDKKTKEFVALGIAIATHCEPCVGFHTEALTREHVTREEFADVLSMAVQMGGGPSLMYAAKALHCWDQLTDESA